MVADTLEDLIAMDWEEMVKQIPDPPSQKRTKVRITRSNQNQSPQRQVHSTNSSNPDISFGKQKMAIFCSQAELEGEPRELANAMLLSLSPEEAHENLQQLYKTCFAGGSSLSSSGGGSKKGSFSSKLKFKKASSSSSLIAGAPLEADRYLIDFGMQEGTVCPLHEKMTGELNVSLKTCKGKFSWHLPERIQAYTMTVEPSTGVFKKKTEQTFLISMEFTSGLLVEEVISLEVQGFGRFFFLVSLEGEYSIFGEDIEQYYDREKGFSIPSTLVGIKDFIVASNALKEPGIFINEGKEDEILAIRDKLNRGMFYDCEDVHSLAKTLIAWYAELKPQILNGTPESLLLSACGQQEYLAIIEKLPQPQQGILLWLLEVLVDVMLESESNGVDINDLAKCIAPALYTPCSADSGKNASLNETIEKLIKNQIEYRLVLCRLRTE